MLSRTVDGEKLRDLRERKLLSQRALALASGVSRQTIQYFESAQGRDKREAHGLTLRRLAAALNVEPIELLVMRDEEAA